MRNAKNWKRIGWMAGAILATIIACEKQAMVGSPETEGRRLEFLYREIDSLAGLLPCDDAREWRFTAIGEKACGGPGGYVAYSSNLDTVAFLDKVILYTELQQEYNRKWNVISDCMQLLPPDTVICEAGKAVLIWDDNGRAVEVE